MEGLFFNIDAGYIEGLVRGYKNSLITSSQYINLSQCDNLEDLKLQLSATDYGNFLADINQTLSTSIIEQKLNKKLIEDFNYIRSQATYPLSKFMDFITYSYMIDNILLIITGTIHNRDKAEILKKCNPLGWFDTLPTLSITTDLNSLYETVLIDTPLAKYFHNCLSIDDLDDLNIEIIRNILYKEYLEDFHNFCVTELPNPTDEIMDRLLNFEADKRTINICINSIDTDLSTEEKMKMLPSIGLLTSNDSIKYQLSELSDLENLKILISSVGPYKEFFNDSSSSSTAGGKSLEDSFYEYEMNLNRNAFTQQFTYSTIWAYIKSKEQEIRNIAWISECIAQNQKDKINNYISVY
ncbi:H(+)-transporting V0 sector ATPase subunit d [Pichia californica]|uniref:V-type proton ATPase subunit n=1 Tax=Pichia californica TaxID=460514 RepID=A0A9P7BI70_9ASCO|nr:H(+)-transporting V0 sector ATPase subunit d [[Candida] californica]KAG0691099.1 H(+)-transporting V0 sector ATPase subunit d [[Candida] californica]